MAKIIKEEFRVLADYIYKMTGIDLDESKEYLVETRLSPLLVTYGLRSFNDLYYKAKADKTGELEKKIIDGISTNETLFFRDSIPFDQFKYRIVPDLLDKKLNSESKSKRKIDIWSAACSSGQEVYSIAISLLEVLEDIEKYDITILGTDISQQALAHASYGKYTKLEIERGMPQSYLNKYFHPVSGGWRINDDIRSMVKFQKLNLMDSFYGLGSFDVIFCRNVAIYFSQNDKRKLFQKLAKALKPEGYLLVGGSESLSGLAPEFQSRHYLRGIYYQLMPVQLGTEERRTSGSNRDGESKPRPIMSGSKFSEQSVSSESKTRHKADAKSHRLETSKAGGAGSSKKAGNPREKETSSFQDSQRNKQDASSSSTTESDTSVSANKSKQGFLSTLSQRKTQNTSGNAGTEEKAQSKRTLLEKLAVKNKKKK